MKRTVLSTLLVAVVVCLSGYEAVHRANERTMHAAQRTFYFRLPSWIAMFVAFLIAVIGNITYLTTRSLKGPARLAVGRLAVDTTGQEG